MSQGAYRRIRISWRVANHVNIIELKHVDENPTNNYHPTDGFEGIMNVIAFYSGVQNKLWGLGRAGTNVHDNSLVMTNSATFMPPKSRRALPAMTCFVEAENQLIVSSGWAFAVPASSPLDESAAPYELRAGSFLSNGSRGLWCLWCLWGLMVH